MMSDSYMDSVVLFHLLLGMLKCLCDEELKKNYMRADFFSLETERF